MTLRLQPCIADPSHLDGEPWETHFDDEQAPHVVPGFGPKHELTLSCWCHPVIDQDYKEPDVISHNVAQ